MYYNYKIKINRSSLALRRKFGSKRAIPITQDQLEIIEMFAHRKKGSELCNIYTLNGYKFTIEPITQEEHKAAVDSLINEINADLESK